MHLVVLAAGKSTRFLPLTASTPKALIPIEGKPLVEYTLDLCIDHVDKIIFVINESLGHKIVEHFGNSYKGIPVVYVIQKTNALKGTMGAVFSAAPMIDQNMFAVCNCDDLYKKEDIDNAFLSNEYGMGLTKTFMPSRYYGIDVKEGFIQGFRKHKESSQKSERATELIEDKFVNGFYIISKDIFSFQPAVLSDGEIGLPQTLFANLDKLPLKELNFSEWILINSPDDISPAIDFIRRNYKNNL